MCAVLELAYWQRTNACIGQHPLRGVLCFPHPREGGPKKLTCSRRVRLGCWVGLGANTPCTFWYGGGGSVSESQAFAPWLASESVAGAARDTSALEAFEDTSEL